MAMNPQFRAMWDAAGYGSYMGSAEVVPPPPKGLVRAYHLTSVEYGLAAIFLGRIKVARFSDLNDPFELLALNLRERRVRKVVRDFKDERNDDTGLLCFSADWTSPALWSHYAAKHRGICLGFDLQENAVQRVQYEHNRIPLDLNSDEDVLKIGDDLQQILIRTKAREWAYEQEIRKVVSLRNLVREGGHYFYRFGDDLKLVEVILGPLCTHPVGEIRSVVGKHYRGVTTIKSRLAFGWFKVVPDERTVPTYGVQEG